jgi:catechol 2,3-dioxygenase-like lactoylglutathione lyase family enzyme
MMKMRSLNHLSLVVSDVERSAEFYQSVFGMERQWQEGDFVFLSCGQREPGGGSDLALVKGKPLIHRRFHFGFRLDSRDEVDAWLRHINGAQPGESPVTHGPQDYGDYYTFSLRDPDGYAVEIYFEGAERGRAGDITRDG